jgi:hypothetical protein
LEKSRIKDEYKIDIIFFHELYYNYMLISSVQADDEEAKPPGLFNPISQEQLNNEDELLRVKCSRMSDGKTGFLIFYEDFVVFRCNSTLLGLFLD